MGVAVTSLVRTISILILADELRLALDRLSPHLAFTFCGVALPLAHSPCQVLMDFCS